MARAHYSSALVIQGPGQPDTGELHRQVAQELDAVHRLFRQWDSGERQRRGEERRLDGWGLGGRGGTGRPRVAGRAQGVLTSASVYGPHEPGCRPRTPPAGLDLSCHLPPLRPTEASLKRRQALAARAFPVGEPFELALLAFNKAGERRRGARMAQVRLQ